MEKDSKIKIIELIPFAKIVLICLIINLALALLVVLVQNRLPPVVPLLYGRPVGEEQLVSKFLLVIPPIIAIIIIFLNIALTKLIKEEFLQKVLLGLIITITILSAITVIEIIFLVGNL